MPCKLENSKIYPIYIDERLIELVRDKPVSFSEAAKIISQEFGMDYTRCQLIGRYNRLKRVRKIPHLDEDWKGRLEKVLWSKKREAA